MNSVKPVKVILDTDIGTDVDDAWALALCLASPEIDLVGVSLVHANLDVRAKIALKMLKLAGCDDIPVYKGLSETLTPGAKTYWAGHEGSETDFSDISTLAARDGAVDFIIETVKKNPGEIVLCSVGPMSNVGEAIRRAPEVMKKLKRLVIMGSTFEGYGVEKSAFEHNATVDPVATKLVFESRIPATIVGLNVTGQVKVRSSDLSVLAGTPLGDYLVAMTRQYLVIIGRDFTFMHDPLAVATLVDPSLVKTQRMRAEVLEDGRVTYAEDEHGWLEVCTYVDSPRFEKLLIERIHARCRERISRKESRSEWR
ncbi:MAG: nucleoside hydrolase [Armatimonadota bacterium]